jgi:hypothetical protein
MPSMSPYIIGWSCTDAVNALDQLRARRFFKVEEVLFDDLGLNKPNCVSASKQSLHDPFVEPFRLRIA